MELRPRKIILFIGILCLAISIILIYVLLFVLKEYKNGGLLSVALMLIGFLSIGLYLTLHYYNYRIKINKKSININNELGTKKEIYWTDIDKVDYNKTFNMFILFSNKKKTWINPIYGQFIDFIPLKKYSEKLKKQLNNTA